jgi:mono/diheme cytochrome c family protein
MVDVKTILAVLICAVSGVALPAPAEDATDATGVIVTVEPIAGPSAKLPCPDARVSRNVALYVPEGAPPSDFTPAGRFRATFKGDLNLRLRSYLRFTAEGRGKMTLSLNGVVVLEASGEDLSKTTSNEIRLNKGKNQLVAVYESPAGGDASVRLFWLSKSFQPEPLPPSVLTHGTRDAEVARSLAAREGRFLVAQLRCTKCHATQSAGAKGAMPELSMDAPALDDTGARFNAGWMVKWIADPHAMRSTAHMPRLFGKDDPRVRDIAAYLVTLGIASSENLKGDAAAGGRLFANLDCVVCHTPPDAAEDPERVPHKYVGAKFKAGALKAFLLRPQGHYVWNPMPDFHLTDAEAEDVTAFLMSGGQTIAPTQAGDAGQGKTHLASSGCLNCHTLGQEKSTLKAATLEMLTAEKLDKGCLASDPGNHGSAPVFTLNPPQREAIKSFLATAQSTLALNSSVEFSQRQVVAMRCTGCHARDGSESLLVQALDAETQALHQKYPNPAPPQGELFAAEQKPPALTYVGSKLRPEWTAKFIGGEIAYKPRYYLRARMPGFGARAQEFAAGLAAEEGCAPKLAPNPAPDAKLAEEGRKLCGKVPNVGFSCVQCHAAGDVPPFAPFEAPSMNLKYVAERLRHDYYMRWIHDPLRIDPASKMPRFDDSEGKTGLPAFGNDAKSQFEAIWQYLLAGQKLQPPQ